MIDRFVGAWWLGGGAKYRASANWYWRTWNRPLSEALTKHDIRIAHATTLQQVVDAFAGKVRWTPDLLSQLWDTIKPPIVLLNERGDDCDGSAMLWAQAVEYALGILGYRARIVSYLADPFALSHHVCIVQHPTGELQAIQPPPSAAQDPATNPLIERYFKTYEQAAVEVASWYPDAKRVQGYDVRSASWGVVEKWKWLT